MDASSGKVFRLVYLSSARVPFTPTELGDILRKSRQNNTQLGVTGLLLYEEGNIIQLLEGEESTVRELYRKISKDPRHKGFIVLLEETGELREFGAWAMAFRNFGKVTDPHASGYSDFLTVDTPQSGLTTKAVRLLNLFKKNHTSSNSIRGIRASSQDPSHRP